MAEAPSALGIAQQVSSSTAALDALFVATVALFLGVATKSVCGTWLQLPVPYEALLLIWGVLLGVGNFSYTDSWKYLSPGIDAWQAINPEFFLALFLSLILFSAAFRLHWHTFRRAFFPAFLVAVPGVVVNAALTALFLKYALPYNWSWVESLLFASILSATDPVSVLAVLKSAGAPKSLQSVLEGQALLNDGSAYVLYVLFKGMVEGNQETASTFVGKLAREALLGPLVGGAFALTVILWLKRTYNDFQVEITLTIVGAFGSYIIGHDVFHSGGVVAVVVFGVAMAAKGVNCVSRDVAHSLHIVWEELEFIANTLVFVISGAIIAGNSYLADENTSGRAIRVADFGWAVVLWLALLVIRGIVFALCFPALQRSGYGCSWREAVVMTWSGLRGAVGLAFSLTVLLDGNFKDDSYRARLFFLMGVVVGLSTIIQGSTIEWLLRWMGLTKWPSVKRAFMHHVVRQVETYGDRELAKVVRRSDPLLLGEPSRREIDDLTSLRTAPLLERYHPLHHHAAHQAHVHWGGRRRAVNGSSKSRKDRQAVAGAGAAAGPQEGNPEDRQRAGHARLLAETRGRLLRAVRSTYESIFERAHVRTFQVYHLTISVDRALDRVDEPLSDWEVLRQQFWIPPWTAALQKLEALPWRWLQQRVRALLWRSLEDNSAMIMAFHYAHQDASAAMRRFDLGDAEGQAHGGDEWAAGGAGDVALEQAKQAVVEEVLKESRAEQAAAEQWLAAARAAYPEVLARIRTKQVAQELLLLKATYIQQLLDSGLVEEKEGDELVGLVQQRMKRLLYAPATMPLLPLQAHLARHPVLEGMDAEVLRHQVLRRASVRICNPHTVLVDSKHDNSKVWLVLRGGLRLQLAGQQEVEVADARGALVGADHLVAPHLGGRGLMRAAALTVVEAYTMPAAALQELICQHAAVAQRVRQAVGTLLAAVAGGPCLAHLRFVHLTALFREAAHGCLSAGSVLRLDNPTFLLSGRVQQNDGQGGSGQSFQGPCLLDDSMRGMQLACITDVQVLHLPPAERWDSYKPVPQLDRIDCDEAAEQSLHKRRQGDSQHAAQSASPGQADQGDIEAGGGHSNSALCITDAATDGVGSGSDEQAQAGRQEGLPLEQVSALHMHDHQEAHEALRQQSPSMLDHNVWERLSPRK